MKAEYNLMFARKHENTDARVLSRYYAQQVIPYGVQPEIRHYNKRMRCKACYSATPGRLAQQAQMQVLRSVLSKLWNSANGMQNFDECYVCSYPLITERALADFQSQLRTVNLICKFFAADAGKLISPIIVASLQVRKEKLE